jgi:hypothetical protein
MSRPSAARNGLWLTCRLRGARVRAQPDLGVAVAFEELDLAPVQAEDLVAVCRLDDAHQGFGMETVGHDGQLGNWPL